MNMSMGGTFGIKIYICYTNMCQKCHLPAYSIKNSHLKCLILSLEMIILFCDIKFKKVKNILKS